MKQILTLTIALAVFIISGCKQPGINDETTKRINTYLDNLAGVGFSGVVLVELNGEIIISKGYGFSNQAQQIKNMPESIYDIGSITKQFTAAAILKLEMQGKLSTDDKISKYFENIPKDKENITIHDLLRHQAGLVSVVGTDYEKITQEEFLNKVLSSTLRFEVGKGFGYSNVGYSLLAMIIEKVSGKTYETYLYENLWHPSEMEMTGYTRPEFDSNLIAVGYYANDSIWGKPTSKEWDKNAPYWHLKGNGGILSTTEELFKWNQILLTDKILSKAAKDKLYHPKLREGENENSIYGYGWDISKTKRNTRQVWHNGTNRIFYADFLRYIDEKCTIIMLTNKSHSNFNSLSFEISKIIFNPGFNPEIPIADNETNRNFTINILKSIEDSGLGKAKSAYQGKQRSEQLLEFMMRNQGFDHLDNNQPEAAMQIFEMNVYAYPKSAKALQGLGEGYMETGKKEEALKYFHQSLAIDSDNKFVEDMIKRLNENK